MIKKVGSGNSYFIVTSINIDNIQELVTIVTEKGSYARQTDITMEKAIDIGFINLNALSKIINQNK